MEEMDLKAAQAVEEKTVENIVAEGKESTKQNQPIFW